MHRLLFLVTLLHQEAGGVYGINGATASHEAALIAGKLNDVTNSSVDNSLKDLHAARKQTNWTVVGAICRTALLFPNRNRLDLCRANLAQFPTPSSLDSIVTQDEKYVFYLNPAKQRVWVRPGNLLPTFVRRDVHGEKHLQSFWVYTHGLVYWKLFNESTTMDSKAMVNEIEEVDLRLELIRSQRFKKVLLFDNAAPRREQLTTGKLAQLGNVHTPHPPYSPDISPCDYHYSLSLQDFLVRRDTKTLAVLENHIEQLINTRPKQFWKDGIRKLAERWQQAIDFNGEHTPQHR
ncbi:unnamed protein product [Heligmosomoides polygyrus]|uniref:DDE_3 domain-containing protein n=1 Tax=Heligmosomoides polygyrus TaxID=6339 RepID=A0A183GBY7_HELPZ|nr:unnamed protein product [Heligmosomoides polygyrus]